MALYELTIPIPDITEVPFIKAKPSRISIFIGLRSSNAKTSFVDFLKRFPQSGYGASGLFWLGNAQYATRDYKEAVINFRALLALMPDHARAPEALLSIANCQLELKDARGARKTFEDLIEPMVAETLGSPF